MRKRMLLFSFSLALTLIGTASQVMGQVLGQPYHVSDKEVTKTTGQRCEQISMNWRASTT